MNKARKRFVLYAMLSVFALLTMLLAVINGINFTMASEDADRMTEALCERNGMFPENNSDMGNTNTEKQFRRMGPMGPDSPDMRSSLRYFTYAFDKDSNAKLVSMHISAVDDDEALEWARGLVNEKGTGWTRTTYRYRVYKENKITYVTIIDQSRELVPSYRILKISVIGEITCLLISFILLSFIGRKIFEPLEEADRKQKRFIANIESDFKVPLTVVNADTELIERESGASDHTRSINRQIRKMTELVKDIGSLAIFEENSKKITKVNLSSTLSFEIDQKHNKYREKGVELTCDIDNDVLIDAEDNAIKQMLSEICENTFKYSVKTVQFNLKMNNDRITLAVKNDTDLPDGNVDQVFDRFTTLSNANDTAIGLGLSHVKYVVYAHNGRVTAKVKNGMFELTITF